MGELMFCADYPIDALDLLLCAECVSERYFPLIPQKNGLIAGLRAAGCRSKSDAEKLSDAELTRAGLADAGLIRLFRRFLTIYDAKPQKFREIVTVTSDPLEQAAFRELYWLPGVRQTRASLYYLSGFLTLRDFAEATQEEILARTAKTIAERGLPCIVPLPKEVRTHIAVARAFTWNETQIR